MDEQHFRTIDKLNPATGELLRQYPVMDGSQVADMAVASRRCFENWRLTSVSQRVKVLTDVAVMIVEQADTLSRLISLETGKPIKEALESDITTATSILHYYTRIAPHCLRNKRLPLDKSIMVGHVYYERQVPKGVIAVITPWNYPFAISVSGIAAALTGGNTVILKPSELTPGVGEKTVALFQAALQKNGFPTDIVQVAQGDGKTGEALTHSDVDYVLFTGSEATGFRVRDAMQKHGKGAGLELGGSDPMIVLEGADWDAVTSYALWGRFTNSGQTCAAVKRLFVPEKEYQGIVSLLKKKVLALRQGDPQDPQNHLGPLISRTQWETVRVQVEDALARGAHLETGGHALERQGWFYAPTLLTHVPPDARILQEEVFGPVLPVIPYTTIEEAVTLANAHKFGLTGSVFGPPKKARQVAERLKAGLTVVNDVGAILYAFPAVPWSGWKSSGPGVSHGKKGLLETTDTQITAINWMYWFPLLQKQPWFFGKEPADLGFSYTLLKSFGNESLLAKLNPAFWLHIFKNRSSRKL